MRLIFKGGILGLLAMCLFACKDKAAAVPQQKEVEEKLFTAVPQQRSNIHFVNEIVETEDLNYYSYIYSYVTGGVAAADFNNDGLTDLFFTAGVSRNELYLNKGDFVFENITDRAGIVKQEGFDMGASIVDINNDGFLDIYLCRGGWYQDDQRLANLLYINNGDLTFTEQAAAYGLADTNRSIASTFFDYDNDGDLDVFISNNPVGPVLDQGKMVDLKKIQKDPRVTKYRGSDKLYRNNGNGSFTDVSVAAGIMPEVGFGLNPQVGDLNNDGWLDICVSNDFDIPDFVYINQGNGTFVESRDQMFKHLSLNSMGSDIADINNDGLNDMLVLEMNPQDYVKSKVSMFMTPPKKFNYMINNGYHHQYMHNVLQLNNGNGTFSEIAYMAGLAKTDWSWSALLADFDLDGYKDVFISNGFFREVQDKDVSINIDLILRSKGRKPSKADFLKVTQMLPQKKVANYFYKNNGDLTFADQSSSWANLKPTFSNGAVYVDLDNDGDLDVVSNNINEPATLLENKAADLKKGNYLQFAFAGPAQNPAGIGVVVNVYAGPGKKQTSQLINARGYLSSVSKKLHFGLGETATIPKVEIVWNDGKIQELSNVKANQLLQINYKDAIATPAETHNNDPLFAKLNTTYRHTENLYDDYKLQLLLPHKLSQLGPALAKADVNKDGFEDIYVGGARAFSAELLLGNAKGDFTPKTIKTFVADRQHEDVAASFFDADEDGDMDLYVVSGSYEFPTIAHELQDRLYLNDGQGNFEKCADCLPKMRTAGGVVAPADFDKDGDLDLFVGGRVLFKKYPYAPASYLLVNEGGKFKVATKELAPELAQIGMVTAAQWTDLDEDGNIDLVLTGEWMGLNVFENKAGKLAKTTKYKGLADQSGWWNSLLVADIDNDGDKDIVAGNLGLNYKFHASKDKPFHIYTKDFDANGVEDIVLAKNYKEKLVPVRGKNCMSEQMPYLKEKIKSYNEFAKGDIASLVDTTIEASALHYTVNEFRSGVFICQEDGSYVFTPFGNEAQRSPINSILFQDFNGDGHKDLLMAGNNYQSEIETTRSDAGVGVYLQNDGQGNFNYRPNAETGFFADKDVRQLETITTAKGTIIFVANNNDLHDVYKVTTPK